MHLLRLFSVILFFNYVLTQPSHDRSDDHVYTVDDDPTGDTLSKTPTISPTNSINNAALIMMLLMGRAHRHRRYKHINNNFLSHSELRKLTNETILELDMHNETMNYEEYYQPYNLRRRLNQ